MNILRRATFSSLMNRDTFLPFSMAILLGTLVLGTPSPSAGAGEKKIDVAKIHGRIQFVSSFPDFKVKEVNSFPDLRVQTVESFSDKPGQWQIVESFPDYKIQVVDSFPEFTIQYVNSFPGPRR